MTKFVATPLDGLWVVEAKVFEDSRGFFSETYNEKSFDGMGLITDWKQDNWSCSQRGVLRGLHLQRDPNAQAKLVRVLRGSVFDVAVDLRPHSITYGQWFGLELSADNKKALYIPAGFAHGFQALQDDTSFLYKCSSFYNKDSELGYLWNDPAFGIDWPIARPFLSEKDTLYLPFEWTK